MNTNVFLKGLSEEEEKRLVSMVNEEMRPGGEYYPLSTANFWEAITEASDEQEERITKLMRDAEPVAVAAALNLLAHDYWFEYACGVLREEAIEQVRREKEEAEEQYRDLYFAH